jgi:cytochrome b561
MPTPQDIDDAPEDGATSGPVSRLNHWAVAAGMLAALGAGLAIEHLPLDPETRRWLLGWHRSIGVAVLAVGMWRLVWRLKRGFPEPAGSTSLAQEALARALHWTLIAATILMPLTGILMTILDGRAVTLAGPLTIPAVAEIPWLASGAESLHALVGIALVGLIALHVAAALKHHFIDGDMTLVRMTSGRQGRDALAD